MKRGGEGVFHPGVHLAGNPLMRRTRSFIWLLIACVLPAAPVHAEGPWTASAGLDYSSGRYGTAADTDILSIPVSVRYQTGPHTLKAALSWLHVRSPADTLLGPDGRPISGGTAHRTLENGPGDLVTSVVWAVHDNPELGTSVDLTGKIKWGTADVAKGLGSGEHDLALQADFYQSVGRAALFASIGYKIYGDPDGVDYDNVAFGGLGGSLRLGPGTSLGLSWDYRPKLTATGHASNEWTLFATRRLTEHTKLQAYLVKGIAAGSPDMGAGLMLLHTY